MAEVKTKKELNEEFRYRASVFRSNKEISVQIIDDRAGKTLVFASSSELKDKKTKTEEAMLTGENLAKKAKEAKISKIFFDRSGYRYHGRVKALTEGMRRGGLEF